MKKVSFSLIFSIIMIIALVGGALAEEAALPGSGWWSGEQIQNVGSSAANIDITAYDSASAATYTKSDTLASGASATYLPGSFTGMPAGFQGSAIVSSNQDIRAIVNVTNRYNAGLGLGDPLTVSAGAAQYQGMNEPSTTLNFPLVKNDAYGKSTTFFIQNAGTAAATATCTFNINGVNYTYTTPSIGPGQMTVVAASLARNAGNPPPTGTTGLGSLTVSSAQPLAGTVLEHKTVELHATVLQATRAFTPSDYSTTIYAPINKNKTFGRFTGLSVQNVSGGPVNITVTYYQTAGVASTCPGGTVVVTKNALAANAGWNFPSTDLGPGCFASAVVVATGSIVGTVNESFSTIPAGRQQESTTYSALPDSKKTAIVSLPLFKENAYAKSTGLTIQNVGAAPATNVVITFKGPTGTYISAPQTIAAGGSVVFLDVRLKPASFWSGTAMTPAALGGCPNNATGCGANGVFGVIVTADQPVVAIANESTYPTNAPFFLQDKNNYEGFNLTVAP